MSRSATTAFLALGLALLVVTGAPLASAQDEAPAASAAPANDDPTGLAKYIGDLPPSFDDPTEVMGRFKTLLEKNDPGGMASLLGLDPAAAVASEDFVERFLEIRDLATQLLVLKTLADDRRILIIGREVWPFPFPIVQTDGKWAFDTEAGLEEIVNRTIGEDELMAIETARGYVQAQFEYRATDWDGDGVPEYARHLISTPGNFDGLYWPDEPGIPESPAGGFVSDDDVPEEGDVSGYFGYRYRILEGQGDEVAGGAYSYVINDNMIAGFGLIARPVTYGVTGVMTFVVNQYGTVYEKDLGPDTAELADAITAFDPDQSWSIVTEVTE
jgi:hypothetical protein